MPQLTININISIKCLAYLFANMQPKSNAFLIFLIDFAEQFEKFCLVLSADAFAIVWDIDLKVLKLLGISSHSDDATANLNLATVFGEFYGVGKKV